MSLSGIRLTAKTADTGVLLGRGTSFSLFARAPVNYFGATNGEKAEQPKPGPVIESEVVVAGDAL